MIDFRTPPTREKIAVDWANKIIVSRVPMTVPRPAVDDVALFMERQRSLCGEMAKSALRRLGNGNPADEEIAAMAAEIQVCVVAASEQQLEADRAVQW